MLVLSYCINCWLLNQIRTSLDFEQRLPSARFYFSEDVHVIGRNSNPNRIMAIVDYVLEYLLNTSFDSKVKALLDSNEKNENLIEEYRVTIVLFL